MKKDVVTALRLTDDERKGLEALCDKHGVQRMYAFGSALREDFQPGESDLDLLVDFGAKDPFELVDAYFGLLNDLRELLAVEVDLVMSDAIKNRYIAAEVDRSKRVLYAA